MDDLVRSRALVNRLDRALQYAYETIGGKPDADPMSHLHDCIMPLADEAIIVWEDELLREVDGKTGRHLKTLFNNKHLISTSGWHSLERISKHVRNADSHYKNNSEKGKAGLERLHNVLGRLRAKEYKELFKFMLMNYSAIHARCLRMLTAAEWVEKAKQMAPSMFPKDKWEELNSWERKFAITQAMPQGGYDPIEVGIAYLLGGAITQEELKQTPPIPPNMRYMIGKIVAVD